MLNPGYKISYLIYPGYKISYLWSTSDTRYPTYDQFWIQKYPIWSTLDTRYPTYALSWMNGWERHWFKLILFTGSRRWIFSKKSVNCLIWNKEKITFCWCRNLSHCVRKSYLSRLIYRTPALKENKFITVKKHFLGLLT